ncbi:sugar phosphate isomerase/epimerase [Bacillus sp. MHSD_36]|uniref:sugar phosphate isomerase/epimerase family protein n=1 Tax=unclassified Bacillus (in: firmicutes) TaxID=185979 RepID=UPI0027408227|nr:MULTISPECIES: sugar phosphate isomerase/epimerase [unclassified Bacillus (in: firmicutes)]MDP7988858.1 sugar phosphate isomerase/epimerase [Bacillus sp. MHSD_36]MDR4977868.1 sugar phosphate isomerase/epimerase [Bacillus sp. MHSD_37]
MKLAFSTNAFTTYTLLEAISEIGKLGYKGVEILADVPHAFPPVHTAAWVTDVRQKIEKYGLEVSNINGNTAAGFFPYSTGEPTFEPSLCNAREEVRNQRIKYTKQLIDLAVIVNAKNISITSGKCLSGNPPDQAINHLINSLIEIMDYAERREINVGIEYEPGLLIENGKELNELIQIVESNRLGANLDLGHADVIREDIPTLLSSLKSRIWNIHLEDIADHKHYHLIPGHGNIDFNQLFNYVKQIKYKGFITVELYTYCDDPVLAAKESIEFLTPYFKNSLL